jgi:maleate isomerase
MRIGVILTHDNAIDAELWRWCPPGVTLHVTRTAYIDEDDCVRWSQRAADDQEVAIATRSLVFIRPSVIAYACTSGSFVGGIDGERRIRQAMLDAGAEQAVTTGGALLDALRALEIRRLAVGTPYDAGCTGRLTTFLEAAGHQVVSVANEEPPPGRDINDFLPGELEALADRVSRPDADAIFLSCTALETMELIPRLEQRYERPVLTSVQVTMWAALAAAGVTPSISDQRLFSVRPTSAAPAASASGSLVS